MQSTMPSQSRAAPVPAVRPVRGEGRAEQGERQREQRVAELDHAEDVRELTKNHWPVLFFTRPGQRNPGVMTVDRLGGSM